VQEFEAHSESHVQLTPFARPRFRSSFCSSSRGFADVVDDEDFAGLLFAFRLLGFAGGSGRAVGGSDCVVGGSVLATGVGGGAATLASRGGLATRHGWACHRK
jgi:hypothetical protein